MSEISELDFYQAASWFSWDDKIWRALICNEHPTTVSIYYQKHHEFSEIYPGFVFSNPELAYMKNRILWNTMLYQFAPVLHHIIGSFSEIEKLYNDFQESLHIVEYLLEFIGEYADIDIVEKFPENWSSICRNRHKGVFELLKEKPKEICWYHLSGNPAEHVVDFLLENFDKIDWYGASSNTNDRIAVHFKDIPFEELSFHCLLRNKSDYATMRLLDLGVSPDTFLSSPSNLSMDILEKWVDTLSDKTLSDKEMHSLCQIENKRVIDILKKHPTKVSPIFLRNPVFFEFYNYEMIQKRIADLKEELLTVVLSTDYVMKWINQGVSLEDMGLTEGL